jgi:hypothetical protein
MSDTYPNEHFRYFYHGEHIYNYALQFMAIFSGLQVSVGKNDYETEQSTIYVPIRYGSVDKTVEWVLSSQTTNKPLRLPMMAAKIISVELAPDLRKGMRQEMANTHLPRGGSLPDDMRVIRQKNPNPCRLTFELSVISSNTKNRFEIMEQILRLFDPDIQIFTSDDFKDHYKISKVELTSVLMEEDYPMGTTTTAILDTYQFIVVAYIMAPVDLKESFVKSIRLRLDAISDLPVDEAVIELNNIGNTGDVLFDVDDMDIPEN